MLLRLNQHKAGSCCDDQPYLTSVSICDSGGLESSRRKLPGAKARQVECPGRVGHWIRQSCRIEFAQRCNPRRGMFACRMSLVVQDDTLQPQAGSSEQLPPQSTPGRKEAETQSTSTANHVIHAKAAEARWILARRMSFEGNSSPVTPMECDSEWPMVLRSGSLSPCC